MEGRELPPLAWAENSIEALLAEHPRGGSTLYRLVLGLVLLGAAMLPLIRVPVGVQGTGIVRPRLEKHEVRAGVSGVVASVRVREPRRVRRGEVIAALRPGALEVREGALLRRIEARRRAVADLRALLRSDSLPLLPPERLGSPGYRAELLQLQGSLAEQEQRIRQAAREAERARALHDRELVSRAELERQEAALTQERFAAAQLRQRARREWETALPDGVAELQELESALAALRQEGEMHRLRAPVDGTLEEMASISPGSVVQAGDRVAVISPEAELVAEVYVTSREIGLLGPGTPVRMELDAFPSSTWGYLSGQVAEVAGDFVLIDRAPRYRVRIALRSPFLEPSPGVRGHLRKGMTLRARFVLAERSLWQLLREDLDDWFVSAPRPEPSG